MTTINCLVIVLGYGYNLTQNYKRYLDMAQKTIRKNHAEVVITTGSYKGNKLDFTDEAAFICDFLHSHGVNAQIITDPNGITTLQSIKDAKKILDQGMFRAKKIIICCEKNRCLKVRVLGFLEFKKIVELKSSELIKNRRDRWYEKYWNTPRDILGYFLPFLEKRKIQQRKQK